MLWRNEIRARLRQVRWRFLRRRWPARYRREMYRLVRAQEDAICEDIRSVTVVSAVSRGSSLVEKVNAIVREDCAAMERTAWDRYLNRPPNPLLERLMAGSAEGSYLEHLEDDDGEHGRHEPVIPDVVSGETHGD